MKLGLRRGQKLFGNSLNTCHLTDGNRALEVAVRGCAIVLLYTCSHDDVSTHDTSIQALSVEVSMVTALGTTTV